MPHTYRGKIGEKIAKPINEQEFKKAAIESIKRVSLLKELWNKVGTNIPETGLWPDLVQITNVNRSIAEKQEVFFSALLFSTLIFPNLHVFNNFINPIANGEIIVRHGEPPIYNHPKFFEINIKNNN